ncbi:MAG: PleD family two-component system response regulator [Candidatus Binatia bacterium]
MTDSHGPECINKIIVVDDDPEMVAMVRDMLEQNDFNVRCALSGAQLFNGLEEQMPDLILLDVVMPQIDGLEILARLKGDRETSSIPVILVTAHGEVENILAGYKLGADYYITKPFTTGQLVSGISSILSCDQGRGCSL